MKQEQMREVIAQIETSQNVQVRSDYAASPVEQALALVEWHPEPVPENTDGLPYVTHSGVLNFNGIDLPVFQLSSGARVIDGDALVSLFGDLLK